MDLLFKTCSSSFCKILLCISQTDKETIICYQQISLCFRKSTLMQCFTSTKFPAISFCFSQAQEPESRPAFSGPMVQPPSTPKSFLYFPCFDFDKFKGTVARVHLGFFHVPSGHPVTRGTECPSQYATQRSTLCHLLPPVGMVASVPLSTLLYKHKVATFPLEINRRFLMRLVSYCPVSYRNPTPGL